MCRERRPGGRSPLRLYGFRLPPFHLLVSVYLQRVKTEVCSATVCSEFPPAARSRTAFDYRSRVLCSVCCNAVFGKGVTGIARRHRQRERSNGCLSVSVCHLRAAAACDVPPVARDGPGGAKLLQPYAQPHAELYETDCICV